MDYLLPPVVTRDEIIAWAKLIGLLLSLGSALAYVHLAAVLYDKGKQEREQDE